MTKPVTNLTVMIDEHFGGNKLYHVTRITKKYIFVFYNDIAEGKYHRENGYEVGAFQGRMSMTPSKIGKYELNRLETFAEQHGGTWDSGWRPKKRS